jgi:hypothetical protein
MAFLAAISPILTANGRPSTLLAHSLGNFALAQLSHRYASDSRNAAENCEVPRPMSICGAKNCFPSRRHLVLTGSTPMWCRSCARSAVRTVERRKSRLNHGFSPGAHLTALCTPWHVWCLNCSAPYNALISSNIFRLVGELGLESAVENWFLHGNGADKPGDDDSHAAVLEPNRQDRRDNPDRLGRFSYIPRADNSSSGLQRDSRNQHCYGQHGFRCQAASRTRCRNIRNMRCRG